LISVKLVAEIDGLTANRTFKREELSGFSTHGPIIRRYMLIKQ